MNTNIIATITITNYDDIWNFAESLSRIPEFLKLSYEEKMRVIFSYPLKYQITY